MLAPPFDEDTPFTERVWAAVRTVPSGRVTTYGDVASVVGAPRAARQVGYALARLPPDTDVPWQRVINAQGRVSIRGLFLRGEEQTARLQAEGVAFDADARCDLARLRWNYPDFR